MNGGSVFRVLAILLLVGVVVAIGVGVYNAGVSSGLNEQVQSAVASGQPVPVVPYGYGYGYGPFWHGPWGFGFGFFGIIFPILGIFLIFALFRAAFGWGRWRGRGGWGQGGGWAGRHGTVEDWHRELHRRDAGDGGERAGT